MLVAFEGGNPEKPFVLGAHYNGAATSGYADANNDFKVIKTRSGHILEFEELKNIKLADAKGNYFHIDSSGENININANETLNITAKNINITATENINTNAGQNMNTSVGIMNSLSVGANYMVNVMGKFIEYVKGNIESSTDEQRQIVSKKAVSTQSSESEVKMNAKNKVKSNSGEQGTLS